MDEDYTQEAQVNKSALFQLLRCSSCSTEQQEIRAERLDRNLSHRLYLYCLTIKKVKAGNGTSMPSAKLREPGKVRAGVSAGVEWTRELQTEGDSPQVGFDGKGTVTKTQGIALGY